MAAKTVKIGIQPTGWTNDDFQEIGDETPYQQILDETKEADYEGGSTGHNYPTHLPSLKRALDTRGLKVTSTWVGTKFTAENQFEPTLDEVRRQIAFLNALGSTDIVVAELAGAVNQVRTKAVLDDRPILNEAQWYLLATGLNEAGRLARESGMRPQLPPPCRHLRASPRRDRSVVRPYRPGVRLDVPRHGPCLVRRGRSHRSH